MYITPLQSEKQTLQITSVKGDVQKIDAVKKLGHGMLSHAFQVGMDVVLGIGADDLQQLESELRLLDEQINSLQSKRKIIVEKMDNLRTFETNKKEAVKLNESELDLAIEEYKRCAPKIIYNKSTQLAEYLAGLLNWTSTSEVRKFFADRTIEPTEEEIRAFLKRG